MNVIRWKMWLISESIREIVIMYSTITCRDPPPCTRLQCSLQVSAVGHEEQNVCSLEGCFCFFFPPHINDVRVIFNLHNFLLYMFFVVLYFTVGSWLELFPSSESWSKVHCIQEVFHQTDTASLINRLHLAWASILLPTNTEMKIWGLALSYK